MGSNGRHLSRSIPCAASRDETGDTRAESLRNRLPAPAAGPRIHSMESVAAMLVIVFQVFFGWCGEEPSKAPPPQQCEAGRNC